MAHQEAQVLTASAADIAADMDNHRKTYAGFFNLMKWVAASGSEEAVHAFALQHRGLSVVAHQVASAVHPSPTLEMVSTLELALVTAVAAATGYAVSKAALAGAIGRDPSTALDGAVRRTLAAMLQSYLRDAMGPALTRAT